MILVDNGGITDPAFNLALEEYLLRHPETGDSLFFLYNNEPSIIVGRNQNVFEEINRGYVRQRGLPVVRRLSGGGTVYHDPGNLNFSFISSNGRMDIHNFKKFLGPVIAVLRAMGVPAEMSNRSDILAAGRKVSGNAQYLWGDRILSHGTLLFNADLDALVEALKVDEEGIESRGIRSVRSSVANLSDFLPASVGLEDLRRALIEGICPRGAGELALRLDAAVRDGVERLAENRYRTWEWNYGASPDCSLRRVGPGGELALFIHRGLIREVHFTREGVDGGEAGLFRERLVGVRYDGEALQDALQGGGSLLEAWAGLLW